MKTRRPIVLDSLDQVAATLDGVGPVSLTIGTFDGVHRAHQVLIGESAERAAATRGRCVVLTFHNHPRAVVEPGAGPALLTSWEDKKALILGLGAEVLVGLDFTPELAAVEAEDFIRDVVAGQFGARFVACGPAFHFGRNRRGNAGMLAAMAGELGYELLPHEPVMHDGEKVSSTRIRAALMVGDVALARAMLGRPHATWGTVVVGDRLGRTLGFPTANLVIDPAVLLPADGVYAVRVRMIGGAVHMGMMNIGWRPTVGGNDHRKEVHLMDFNGDLEGQRLRVEYVARLRDEQRFVGVEALKAQLVRDREAALAVLGGAS